MARTLTSPAAAEAAKQSGANFVRILEIRWPDTSSGASSGAVETLYYSTEDLTSPVTADGRVMEFAVRQLDAQPGKANSHQTMTLKLADPDLSLKSRFDTQPGVQAAVALVHLHFVGTTWPDDRVTEIAGMLTTPMSWDEKSGSWTVTLRGLEYFYDQDLGEPLRRQEWPEVSCNDCEGEIIPIAYGRPVRRVPACVIDRPGSDVLAATFSANPPDSILTITREAADAAFTVGSFTSLIIGHPGNWERVWGIFDNSDDTTFTVTARGAWEAVGTTTQYASEGNVWLTISDADLSDGTGSAPVASASRGGHAILFRQASGVWVGTIVTNWADVGGNRIAVCHKGGLDVPDGAQYRLLSMAGKIPNWPPGTPVHEEGNWVYACNFLPSEEVERVEARGNVNVNGESKEAWYTFHSDYYTVDLDDKSWNSRLGRDPNDPGLTTVTLDNTPINYGFSEETIWVTMKGIVGGAPGSGGGKFSWVSSGGSNPSGASESLANPAEVIHHLINNEYLGNIPDEFVNSDAFAAAAADITTLFAFAILDKRKLHDIISDLSHQAMCLYLWDEGQASLRKLDETLSSGDSQLTLTQANLVAGSVKIEEVAVKDYTTIMQGRFRLSLPAPELKMARRSDTAVAEYGRQTDELDLWAYQYATSAAKAIEFWLRYRLHLNRLVTFETYLVGLHLQPGDVITLNINNGAGVTLFASVLARVRSVRQTPGSAKSGQMEKLQIVAEVSLFSYAIEVSDPGDEECAYTSKGKQGTKNVIRERKLYVRSDGINSMYVKVPRMVIESAASVTPIDSPACDPDDPACVSDSPPPPPPPPPPPTLSSGASSSGTSSGSSDGSSAGSGGSGSDSSGSSGSSSGTSSGGCPDVNLTMSVSGGFYDGESCELSPIHLDETCQWEGFNGSVRFFAQKLTGPDRLLVRITYPGGCRIEGSFPATFDPVSGSGSAEYGFGLVPCGETESATITVSEV